METVTERTVFTLQIVREWKPRADPYSRRKRERKLARGKRRSGAPPRIRPTKDGQARFSGRQVQRRDSTGVAESPRYHPRGSVTRAIMDGLSRS